MSAVRLSLLVLRVPDMDRAADFYSALGMEFTRHSHGNGPEHYAAEMDGMVFELYPLATEDASTRHTRIGFSLADPVSVIAALEAKGAKVVSPLKDSPWGIRAVIDDPFRHRVEITECR